MKKRAMRRQALMSAVVLLVLASSTLAEGSKKRMLNRSVYLPVDFGLCLHMKYGVLYMGDQAVARLPSQRVFLFTYYPDLKRMEPPVTWVRIEGMDDEEKPLLATLAISPEKILTDKKTVDFDLDEVLRKFTYKRDVRYKKIKVLVQCKRCDGTADLDETDPEDENEETKANPSENLGPVEHLQHDLR